MKRTVFLPFWFSTLAFAAIPCGHAASVPMWMAVEVTQVDAGITSLAVGDRFAIGLVVNDSVLDTNSSVGGGQFPNLLSNFAMTALPGNTGTWQPSGTFNLATSNFVTNAFGNAITFQVRGSGFPTGGLGLPFFDVDLNFPWMGDITDSGLGNSFAQQLGTTFDPTRAVLGGSAIRFGASAQAEATLAVPSNFALWNRAGTGSWTTATNWRPHSLPTSTTDVNISNGGTAQITATGALARDVVLGQVALGGTGHLQLTTAAAALTAADVYVGHDGTGTLSIAAGSSLSSVDGIIGHDDGSSGTVIVSGAGSDWSISGNMAVADEGNGVLTVSAGGSVSSNLSAVALDNGSTGTVTVTGAGSTWTSSSFLVVGVEGEGELTVANGGSVSSVIGDVGRFATGPGIVTVTGNGSSWTNSGPLGVGDEGAGTLTIQNGGHVSNTDGSIGFEIGSDGTVNVDGAGSTWTNSNFAEVGRAGTGTLNITNGGDVTNTGGQIAIGLGSHGDATVSGEGSTWTNSLYLFVGNLGTATLTIEDGGDVANTIGAVGANAESNGTATVTGVGSTWTNSDDLAIGLFGDGELFIEAGGSVSNADGLIGQFNNATGEVTVTGAGSTWFNSGNLSVGEDGTGTLNILNGGSVSNVSGFIGHNSTPTTSSTGTVTVSGTDSTWINIGNLLVGASGEGILNILDGGAVLSNTALTADDRAYIGLGADGVATVSGAGSVWSHQGSLHVGNDADGELTIDDGGMVLVSAFGRIGVENDPLATVTVSGAGSAWNMGGDLTVADGGLGELVVATGGSVESFDAQIARETGATGTATLSGAGSTWTIGGRLGVGGNARNLISGGTATLRIQPGSKVSTVENTVIFSGGQLKLEGGTFGTSAISFQGGGQFQWTSGTLHVGIYNGNLTNPAGGTLAPGNSAGSTTIVGNYTQQAGATLQIEIGGPFAGGTYDLVSITGNANLGGELELAMLNGFVPSGSTMFTVLNAAGGIAGAFSNVANGQRLATIDGSGSFLVHYGPGSSFSPNQIVLNSFVFVALAGDFNRDNKVDAADYVMWRKTDGSPGGYDAWRTNFGRTAGSGSASNTTVPEPSTAWMFALSATIGFWRTTPTLLRSTTRWL
jgi:T5SS/PEP-CTERM-associated repeat protein